ncbi:MAG: phosphoribosylaminoimidazolesuccinocarboxamide synthase [Candidatus Promineifilaceae bacterium]
MISLEELTTAADNCLVSAEIPTLGTKITGKVRDIYPRKNKRILITSDRVSAFDSVLGVIPFKGQVLNQLSAWWFEQTRDIVANHVLDIPDPNVCIAREAQTLPVEVVVRGYITGVTTTSLWYLYEQGDREPYGVPLPDGMQKNDPLPQPIITPTTKAENGAHDEVITSAWILQSGLIEPELWREIETTALALFAHGQALAAAGDMILVDTKYEFGLVDGQLTLIDEVHTPDSSRYWDASAYAKGDIINLSKEFMREWYAAQGYRGEGTPPQMPTKFRAQIAERYISVYERLTGKVFVPGELPAIERIARNLGKEKQ